MRRHFQQRHNTDYVTILEEGPLPKCSKCGIQLRDVGPRHQESKACQIVETRNYERNKYQENVMTRTTTKFLVFGQEIETVTEFKYLGRTVTQDDDDRQAIRKNLHKAQGIWGRLARLLTRADANKHEMTRIYRAVIHSILLYGSESWSIPIDQYEILERFHKRCLRYITGKHIRKTENEEWVYPRTADLLQECKMKSIREYVTDRQKMAAQKYLPCSNFYQQNPHSCSFIKLDHSLDVP
jgi:hypothetical protein